MRKRNVKKHVEEWHKLKGRNDCITVSELKDILAMSNEHWEEMVNAFYFGYMVGYKRHKKEQKERMV